MLGIARPMRRISALVAGALLALVPAHARSADAMSMLRQAVAANKHVSYVGQVQVLRFGQKSSEAAIYRVEHRAPDMTRRWYLAPQDIFGDSTISRGTTTFSVDVKRNRVVVSDDPNGDEQLARNDNFDLLAQNYHASTEPDEDVAGRKAHVFLLSNKYTGEATMRVYVDAQTSLVLQKQEYSNTGSLISQYRIEQLRYTSDIPSAIFTVPNMPQSVQTPHGQTTGDISHLVGQVGFKAQNPKYLPEGFYPIAGDVSDVKGVRTLHLLFSDGIRTISLFQNASSSAVDLSHYQAHETTVEENKATYVEDGPNTLLTWSESGLHFALVGDLSLNELRKIAGSVVPD